MDYNTNNTELQEVRPNRDYNPRGEKPRPAVYNPDERRDMPRDIHRALEKPRKRYGLRLTGIILCALIVVGSGFSGVMLRKSIEEENKKSAAEEIKEALAIAETIPEEPEIYTAPEKEWEEIDIVPMTEGEELTTAQMYESCSESVVSITGIDREKVALGTGIIMSESGFIITNQHIIDGSALMYVTLHNDRVYPAMLVGQDEDMDIAVLKIDAPNLKCAAFGDSDILTVGESVVTIGNPTSSTQLRHTLTAGIVSAVNREMEFPLTLIQTDASINSGNSGGPLINRYGQVVGITVMKITSNQKNIEGLGFAIPITSVKTVIEEIIRKGEYEHPNIGIIGFTVDAESAAAYGVPRGVMVNSVTKGAEKNGCELESGDIIVEICGIRVKDMAALSDIKYRQIIGDTIEMLVYRDGDTITVSVPMLDSKTVS